MKPNISFVIILLFTSITFSCQRVPITGRKQLNLVPNALIQAMALTEYDSFLTLTRVFPPTDQKTQMVNRVGLGIQKAVEQYMLENNLTRQIKDFKWEYNLVDDGIANAWCMPGGKVVVYTGLLPITQNENGLAVVMGHEIAHAIARHGNERIPRDY